MTATVSLCLLLWLLTYQGTSKMVIRLRRFSVALRRNLMSRNMVRQSCVVRTLKVLVLG